MQSCTMCGHLLPLNLLVVVQGSSNKGWLCNTCWQKETGGTQAEFVEILERIHMPELWIAVDSYKDSPTSNEGWVVKKQREFLTKLREMGKFDVADTWQRDFIHQQQAGIYVAPDMGWLLTYVSPVKKLAISITQYGGTLIFEKIVVTLILLTLLTLVLVLK